jgi:hypothetical protein
MIFNLSVLDQLIDLDVCIRAELPEDQIVAVKQAIRRVATSGVAPPEMAGLLVQAIVGMGACVELLSEMQYDGYAVTIDCENKQLCIQDYEDIDCECYFDFRQHEVDYVDFRNLACWSD